MKWQCNSLENLKFIEISAESCICEKFLSAFSKSMIVNKQGERFQATYQGYRWRVAVANELWTVQFYAWFYQRVFEGRPHHQMSCWVCTSVSTCHSLHYPHLQRSSPGMDLPMVKITEHVSTSWKFKKFIDSLKGSRSIERVWAVLKKDIAGFSLPHMYSHIRPRI